MDAIQLSLPLMPTKIDELYIDQVRFLPFMYTENTYQYEEHWSLKASSEMRKMDSDYCHRVRSQADSPETVKKELLDNVASAEKMWKDYFEKNARIYKGKYGTLTFIDISLEREWKKTEKETEKMLKYVGESPEDLREEIICNPHLHACIKQNLLENLDNILKHRS